MNTTNHEFKSKNLFRKDTPLYITILLIFFSGAIVYCLFPHSSEGKKIILVSQEADCLSEMELLRSSEYKFTHPLLLADVKSENPSLNVMKEKLNQFIAESKASNGLTDISIYYRNMNNGAWFEINGYAVYNPASLMKLAYLITALKQAENNPRFLDKQVFFANHFSEGNNQNIKDFKLSENRNYTIRELLQFMIANSDNDAAYLITQNTNPEVLNKLLTDLAINRPPANGGEYFISVIDYCKLFRVLYNGSYLKAEHSEFALELLTKSTFKDGLLNNPNITFPVAHKFGERIINKIQQLHETGIFYLDRQPYMLGVMSSGQNLKQLSSILSHVSEIVYKETNKN